MYGFQGGSQTQMQGLSNLERKKLSPPPWKILENSLDGENGINIRPKRMRNKNKAEILTEGDGGGVLLMTGWAAWERCLL